MTADGIESIRLPQDVEKWHLQHIGPAGAWIEDEDPPPVSRIRGYVGGDILFIDHQTASPSAGASVELELVQSRAAGSIGRPARARHVAEGDKTRLAVILIDNRYGLVQDSHKPFGSEDGI